MAFLSFYRKFSSILKPEKLFLNPKINKLLKNLIDENPTLVHSQNMLPNSEFKIDMLTEDQLTEVMNVSKKLTEQKLQMPPIKEPRIDTSTVIETNDIWKGSIPERKKLVVVDINLWESSTSRVMAVREADGTLRSVTLSERERYNQIYFPIHQRQMFKPVMLEEDNLLPILEQGRYKYILDTNCVQYEPDHPVYIDLCKTVYDHILKSYPTPNGVRSLSTTRHFGGLCLYFCINNTLDIVIADCMNIGRYDCVLDLLRLFVLVHPDSSLAREIPNLDDIELNAGISAYLKHNSVSASCKNEILHHLEEYNTKCREIKINNSV